jgi:hypothetical protein
VIELKSLRLKISDDETVFYRQGIFKGDDDLLIFSLDDFLKFKEELNNYLTEIMEIVEDSRNKRSKHGPTVDAQRILNWIKKMEAEIEQLDQTDVQKNLNAYKK